MPVLLGTRTIAQDPLGADQDGHTLVRSGYPGSTLSSLDWQNWLLDHEIERGHMGFRNCYCNMDVASVDGSNNALTIDRYVGFENEAATRGEVAYIQLHVNGDTSGAGGSAHNIIWAPDPDNGQPAFNNTAELPGAPSPEFWSIAHSLGNGDATGYQGHCDPALIAIGNQIKALGTPAIVCFQHEPDDDYTGNGYTGSTFRNAGMANWARAFNHLVALWTANIGAPGSAGFPNLLGYMPTFMQIHMRTISGGQTSTPGQPTYKDPNAHWRAWYDGLNFTPYAIGVDYYISNNDAFSTFQGLNTYSGPNTNTRGADFCIDEVARLATVAPTHVTVPKIIFGEVGYSPCGVRKDGSVAHRKGAFLRGLRSYCKTTKGAAIIGVCLQGNLPPQNSGSGYWDYDPADDADAQIAMDELWNDPYFGGPGGVVAGGNKYDLKADGGADGVLGSATNAADLDNAAWDICVTKALADKWFIGPSGAAQGVITIPAGKYRFQDKQWKSNIRLEVDAGATLAPWGTTNGCFTWGVGGAQISNVSIVSTGSSTANKPATTSFWTNNVPLPYVSALTGITWPYASCFVANMDKAQVGTSNNDAKFMVIQWVDSFLIDGLLGIQNCSGQDEGVSPCNNATVLFLRHQSPTYDAVNKKHPTNGRISNCGHIDSPQGYGLLGIWSLGNVTVQNLWGVGGDPVRIETGTQVNQGRVGQLNIDSIEVINGSCAMAMSPHDQVNGVVNAKNLWSVESESAVKLSKGTGGSFAAGCTIDCVNALGKNTTWNAALIAAGGNPKIVGSQKGFAQWDDPVNTTRFLLGMSRKAVYFNNTGAWYSNVAFGTVYGSGTFNQTSDVTLDASPCSVALPPPPPPTLTAEPTNPTLSTGATFTAIDAQSGTWKWQIDGGGYSGTVVGTTDTKTYTGLSTGNHQVDVKINNANGDSGVTSYIWTINGSTPPADPVYATVPADSTLQTASASWTQAGATTSQTSLDGAAFADQTSPVSLANLSVGAHTLKVRVYSSGPLFSGEITTTWNVLDQGEIAAAAIPSSAVQDGGLAWHWVPSTTLGLMLPDNAQIGDTAYMVIGTTSSSAITPAAGWTQLSGSPQNSGTGVKIAVYRRILDGTETAPITSTLPNGGGGFIWLARSAYTVTGTPEDGNAGATSSNVAGTAFSVTGPTTTTDGDLLVYAAVTNAVTSFTTPAGFTEILDKPQDLDGLDKPLTFAFGYKHQATAAAVGAVASTIANSSKWVGMVWTILPAHIQLSVTQPPSDITVTARAGDPFVVAGVVTSALGISGVTVNGVAVTVAADGSFSSTQTLSLGNNVFTVVATESGGNTDTVTRTVIAIEQVVTVSIDLSADAQRIQRIVIESGLDPT